MIGKIQYRAQQDASTIARDANVVVYAPSWVKKALTQLVHLYPVFKNSRFNIEGTQESITIKESISLTALLAIARNEKSNTNGKISPTLYPSFPLQAVVALKDLARHCVVVGSDYTERTAQQAEQQVTVCDLSGLQFQLTYNSGRHVLIAKKKDDLIVTDLDNEIYQKTVGEPKATYENAAKNGSGRYVKVKLNEMEVLFDTFAYHRFVAQDFVLAALSLDRTAKAQSTEINFKFQKYGTGIFAENLKIYNSKQKAYYSAKTEDELFLIKQLAKGVLLGLKDLLAMPQDVRSQIKRIELPFYATDADEELKLILIEIRNLCGKNAIEYSDDAVAALVKTKYKTATTNCSSRYAPTGNTMGVALDDVDAYIARSLKGKANKFSPVCNPAMTEEFVYIPFRTPVIKEMKHRGDPLLNWFYVVDHLIAQIPGYEKAGLRTEGEFKNGNLIFSFKDDQGQIPNAAFETFLQTLSGMGYYVWKEKEGNKRIALKKEHVIKFAKLCGFTEADIRMFYESNKIDYDYLVAHGEIQAFDPALSTSEDGLGVSLKPPTVLASGADQPLKPPTVDSVQPEIPQTKGIQTTTQSTVLPLGRSQVAKPPPAAQFARSQTVKTPRVPAVEKSQTVKTPRVPPVERSQTVKTPRVPPVERSQTVKTPRVPPVERSQAGKPPNVSQVERSQVEKPPPVAQFARSKSVVQSARPQSVGDQSVGSDKGQSVSAAEKSIQSGQSMQSTRSTQFAKSIQAESTQAEQSMQSGRSTQLAKTMPSERSTRVEQSIQGERSPRAKQSLQVAKSTNQKWSRPLLFSGLVGIAPGITSGALAYATLKGSSTLLVGLPYVKSAIEFYLELKGTSALLYATGVSLSVGVAAFVLTTSVLLLTTMLLMKCCGRKNSQSEAQKLPAKKQDGKTQGVDLSHSRAYTPRHSEMSQNREMLKSSVGASATVAPKGVRPPQTQAKKIRHQ
ncbi:MAG: hypothetical protein ACHQJ6_01905 [Candidatus Berkiellales bacterium]